MSVHRDEYNSKKWVVVHKGKKKRGFNSKFEAQQYESKLKLYEEDISCTVKYSFVVDSYLDDLLKNASYATYSKAKRAYENNILPNIKNKNISQYTELDCKQFSDYLYTLSCSTIHKNYLLNKFIAIFKYAIQFYHLKNTPYLALKPFKKRFDEVQKSKAKVSNVWSLEEFNCFISRVKIEKYRLLFITLYFTGMRLGEALALTWNDLNGNYLKIYKSISKQSQNGSFEVKAPKTVSSVRDVYISDDIKILLEQYKDTVAFNKGFVNSWYIFGNVKPLPRTNIDRVKNRAIKDSGVKFITLHGFRHSHASNLIASGINIVAVSNRLGHSDVNITLKVYTHLMPKNSDEITQYLEKSFQNLPTDIKKALK